jgi:hypothetical protein
MNTTNTIETRSKSRITADTFIDHAIVRITGTKNRIARGWVDGKRVYFKETTSYATDNTVTASQTFTSIRTLLSTL